MTVVISRFWKHPEITVTVNQDKISVVAKLDDFIDALAEDILSDKQGSMKLDIPFIDRVMNRLPEPYSMGQEEIKKRIYAAVPRVIEKIKEATQ